MTDAVERVVAALNARDLDAFLACYTADATIENGYDRVAARGRAEMRVRYGQMFEEFPGIRMQATWRTEVGEFVVQEEAVCGRGEHERHVAVYLIENGLIARERLFA